MPDIRIDEGTLHYQREGAGDPIIFVSGLGGTAAFWSSQIGRFSSLFSVISYDHRGVGGSTGRPPYRVQQWSDDLLALADHLSLDRFHLVGHSTGGIISQVFAAGHQERIRSLVLSGSWLSPDRRFRDLFALRRDILISMGEAPYARFGNLLACSEPRQVGHASNTPPDVVLGRIEALLAHEGESYAASIRSPTLVLAAADDYIVPAYLSKRLAGAIAGAQIVLREDGGHFFPQTRADGYNKTLSDFWARVADQ